jgi:hypothetical protein
MVPVPQFTTVADGLTVKGEQLLEIFAIETVGGFFITTLFELVTVPQAFVTESVIL